MQFKKTPVRLLLILFPFVTAAQTTYLPQGDKANILLERLEIKAGKDSVLNFSFIYNQYVLKKVFLHNLNFVTC